MCAICRSLVTERAHIDRELKEMPCGKRPLKQLHRRAYYREYYQRHREKKLAAANERNRKNSVEIRLTK